MIIDWSGVFGDDGGLVPPGLAPVVWGYGGGIEPGGGGKPVKTCGGGGLGPKPVKVCGGGSAF